ncbi:MAG: bifunctional diaminohydroxyphosphoribosylaminopyrimidine deaminase/5-amino-6-(5-phosphoribosylamino)uracil reductase RibD [Bacteroidota bacterium]|nr:bifunctional diaminohydroxyphosphoribosylaminopyrimidine deaminase/5-amino-6-(5-phosphoribosylamino)uracil reductase RibD [Bacteroidota bacterium]
MELAALGAGKVSPNPMVGCVIVHNDTIIGEGWHQIYGGPHAEVNAVNSVKNKSLLQESTVYVNLEPCSHFGKTPPCADLLIKNRVKRVVVSNLDYNPVVSGRGMAKLREAGIVVEDGLHSAEGKILNKRFFTFHTEKRPYVILKWAETADGFIARKDFDSKWISNELSRKMVHKWRSEEDAILVGANTAFYDNPQLNVRDWSGKNPLRLVMDRYLRLSGNLNLFSDSGRTIVYNLLKNEEQGNTIFVKVEEQNLLINILEDLYSRNILSVIVEGGAQILNQFMLQNLWDEARVFKSSASFGSGIEAPRIKGELLAIDSVLDDHLFFYNPI